MKKITITLLFSFLFITAINAQGSKYRISNFYEGYIIKNDGTKERGYIMYLDESERYTKVIFKKEKKAKKQRFKVKDIKGYKVAGVTYHALQYKAVVFKAKNFLKLENEGCISSYSMRNYNNGAWDTEMIIELDDNVVSTQTFALSFAKKMSEFIKVNKALSSKVKNKEKGYRILSIQVIIDKFNADCAKQ